MADSRNSLSTDVVSQAVAACLIRHAQPGDSVAVAFSGGLDSSVLLHAASCLATTPPLDLSAVHVHHSLSSNADAWANTCTKVCSELMIPLEVRRVAVSSDTGKGVEAAARDVRHRALEDHPASWILLAHHEDDQAETVLHNLLRGSGVRGVAAIPESRGRFLRPLLGIARATLYEYATSHGLTWIEDDSNDDCRYTRNFLRHQVLPVISSRFPRAVQQLSAASRRFSEADALLDDLARMDLDGRPPEFPLPMQLFRELSERRARNLLRALIAWHHKQPPDERRLTEFVRQLRTAGSDRHPRIDPENYALWCEQGALHFKRLD